MPLLLPFSSYVLFCTSSHIIFFPSKFFLFSAFILLHFSFLTHILSLLFLFLVFHILKYSVELSIRCHEVLTTSGIIPPYPPCLHCTIVNLTRNILSLSRILHAVCFLQISCLAYSSHWRCSMVLRNVDRLIPRRSYCP